MKILQQREFRRDIHHIQRLRSYGREAEAQRLEDALNRLANAFGGPVKLDTSEQGTRWR